MELIHTSLYQTLEQIVETAIQEDADSVGVSILSGAHMTLVPRIVEGLRANRADDVHVVGGAIPQDDADELKALSVAEVFGQGSHDERDCGLPARRRRSLSAQTVRRRGDDWRDRHVSARCNGRFVPGPAFCPGDAATFGGFRTVGRPPKLR